MILLQPIVHNTIWGGPKIGRLTGVAGDCIGHLYSLYCRDGVSNLILNGPHRGQTLNDVFPLLKDRYGMASCEFFPLTLALTEAHENLSIQVHPDDRAANAIEHLSRGKRESWYFIDAPASGTIINGCTCRDAEELARMVAAGAFMAMADSLAVRAGDYVFVEPGTLHAITAGSLVFEIEEGADFTYRFYDYDRTDDHGNKRELHLDKALSVLDINLKSTARPMDHNEISEKTYTTRMITDIETYTNGSDTIECFTLVKGVMECDGMSVPQGSTILLEPREVLHTALVKLGFVTKFKEL